MADADLVLEGGGVKGAGLAGALSAMVERADPYTFHRVAGTSAGAIVASMIASGLSADDLKQIMLSLDFSQFEDQSRIFKHFKELGEGVGLIFKEGMFKGDLARSRGRCYDLSIYLCWGPPAKDLSGTTIHFDSDGS